MKKENKKIPGHGRTFKGVVVNDKMQKSATIEWDRIKKVSKFERFEKARTRIKAHNVIGAEKGDFVKVCECRPLSKTKHFIITEIIESKNKVRGAKK